jgi:hypothetical protein
MQFRLNHPRLGNSRGGRVHERIQYADVEAKKANRNDEAEGAQTEIHRGLANEGAEPAGSAPLFFYNRSRLACDASRCRLRFLTDRRRRFITDPRPEASSVLV